MANSEIKQSIIQYLQDHCAARVYLPARKAATENIRVMEKVLKYARRDITLSDFTNNYDQILMDDLGEYWKGWRQYLMDNGLWTGEDLQWETRQQILNWVLNKVLAERAEQATAMAGSALHTIPADSNSIARKISRVVIDEQIKGQPQDEPKAPTSAQARAALTRKNMLPPKKFKMKKEVIKLFDLHRDAKSTMPGLSSKLFGNDWDKAKDAYCSPEKTKKHKNAEALLRTLRREMYPRHK
jgi:hypothetical protein